MLTLVATPLGNLQDLTFRAVEALRSADLIAAEDTRHTGHLLAGLEIRKPLLSLHDHNEVHRLPQVLERLTAGESVVLVTDAGMPCVSDPGYRVVRACLEAGLPLTVLPGPSAVLTALAGSGLPPHPFYFGGFLPVKSGRRLRELASAVERGVTHVYFESPHRLVKTLAVLDEIAPLSQVCVARELTKRFEEYRRGSPGEVLAHYQNRPPKGEITLVFHPSQEGWTPPEIPPEEEEEPTPHDSAESH